MHLAAAPRLTIQSALRWAAIALNLVLAAACAFVAAYSLVMFADPFPLETLPRGERLLWRLSLYVPDSVRFAVIAALFAAAAVGLRRQAGWRWWAQGAAMTLLLFPFAVRLLLG